MSVPLSLVRRYQAHLDSTGHLVATAAQRAWDGLGSWDEPDMTAFGDTVNPIAAGGQLHAAALASGFVLLVAHLDHSSVPPLTPPGLPDWSQAFQTYWKALSDGNDWSAALQIGRNTLDAVSSNAVQGAARDATAQIDRAESRLAAWQRIPDAGACDWCLTVADQSYHSAESADFGHDRCGCTVAPA